MSSFVDSFSVDQNWFDTHPGPYIVSSTIGVATITLLEDVTLTSPTKFFIAGSDNLLFEGNGKTITLVGASYYPGFYTNGNSGGGAFGNVVIQNLRFSSSGSTLMANAGWIGAAYFGQSASGPSQIIGCFTDGPIPNYGGGVSGYRSTELSISKCVATGSGSLQSGGIVGANSTNVSVTDCYSLGAIGTQGGGIVGANTESITISLCYSTGVIGDGGGGIIGLNCVSPTITQCYSTGAIGSGSGGIVGEGSFSPILTACYTSGNSAVTNTGGIIANSSSDPVGCYSEANHSQSGWNDVNAVVLTSLSWVSVASNTPYYNSDFNGLTYSPSSYTRSDSTTYVSNTPSTNIVGTFTIFAISEPHITIDASGVLTFGDLIATTYNVGVIVLALSGEYDVTFFSFTQLPCILSSCRVLTPKGYVPIGEIAEGDEVISLPEEAGSSLPPPETKGVPPPGKSTSVRKVVRVISHVVPVEEEVLPYVIPRGFFSAEKKVYLSANHGIMIGKNYYTPENLRLNKISKEEYTLLFGQEIKYVSLEIEGKNAIFVEGVKVESFRS